MTEITKKEELIDILEDSNRRVTEWFTAIPANDFFTRQGEVWSASDNVDHLIKAHKPIAMALKLTKITLRARFGKFFSLRSITTCATPARKEIDKNQDHLRLSWFHRHFRGSLKS